MRKLILLILLCICGICYAGTKNLYFLKSSTTNTRGFGFSPVAGESTASVALIPDVLSDLTASESSALVDFYDPIPLPQKE